MKMVPLDKAELPHCKQKEGKKLFFLKSQQRVKMKTRVESCNCEDSMILFALS